ncbi:DUF4189 domain-containing protein [Xanthomonas sp. 1678]|uniref:DUF4189 domain-containing protein n=1 Tax=Xanthomonas sp. 1678 TaxID=3158788 RepID=UPI0028647801|nr:hypothetical protein [Xanthomonas translucens]
MKIKMFVAALFFGHSMLGYAQTACPVGTAPGSATCGPSPNQEVAVPPPTPSGEWIKTWGGIATSSSGGGGVSSGRLSKEEAEDVALQNCKASGAKNCKVEFVYKNQCVSLVYPINQNGGMISTAATVESASRRALEKCRVESGGKQCKVAVLECSNPIFRKF